MTVAMTQKETADFFRRGLQETLENFKCQAVIVIPVYGTGEQDGMTAPVLYANIDSAALDKLLDKAGKNARKNIRERKKVQQQRLPTDLTPTFNAPTIPSA
jgi:nitrogen regulatory protein PII